MSILTKIFGTAKKAEALDSLQAVDAALTRLRAERNAAEDVIAAASSRRRELLLADASDKQIQALDGETDAASLALDRLDVIEPQLIARRAELLDVERRAIHATLTKEADKAVRNLDKAAEALIEALDPVMEIARQMEVAGFRVDGESLVSQLPLIGGGFLASRENLERWRRERERINDAKAAALMPFVAPTPAPAAKVVPIKRREIEPPAPSVSYRVQEPEKITAPVAPGFTRLEAVMSNVDGGELGVNRMLVRGDQIDLPAGEAARVLKGAAFKYVCGANEGIEGAAE